MHPIAGKSGGEFFTPADVSELLTRLGTVGKTEINITTYNLCRINMFLHDIGFDKFDIACEDTREKIDIKKLNAEIERIVAREQVLWDKIAKIIAEIEV